MSHFTATSTLSSSPSPTEVYTRQTGPNGEVTIKRIPVTENRKQMPHQSRYGATTSIYARRFNLADNLLQDFEKKSFEEKVAFFGSRTAELIIDKDIESEMTILRQPKTHQAGAWKNDITSITITIINFTILASAHQYQAFLTATLTELNTYPALKHLSLIFQVPSSWCDIEENSHNMASYTFPIYRRNCPIAGPHLEYQIGAEKAVGMSATASKKDLRAVGEGQKRVRFMEPSREVEFELKKEDFEEYPALGGPSQKKRDN